jgi:hypothetical protein
VTFPTCRCAVSDGAYTLLIVPRGTGFRPAGEPSLTRLECWAGDPPRMPLLPAAWAGYHRWWP